jgi:ligand-binding sensor domain-containing protein/signal transduction histidine kinase
MRFQKNCLLIIFLSLFAVQKAASQTFPTKHYTIREGLAQMQALSVLEDSRGILWVATKGGLSKFDGRNFKNYRRIDGDSLTSDIVFSLKEDSKGNIWICTAGGINKFDGVTFSSWRLPNAKDVPNALYVNKKDEVFVVSAMGYFKIINGKLSEVKITNEPKNLRRMKECYDVEKDKIIFSYTDDKPKPSFLHYELNQNQLKLVEKNDFGYLYSYQYGDEGIVTNYISTIEQKTQYWFLAKGQKERKLILTVGANSVKVHQTLPFNFAFAFQSKLTILEKNTTNYQQLADNFLENSCVQVDKNGIWAGTETGLWRVMDNGIKYIPASRDAVVWSMVEDKYNRLWTFHYNAAVPIKVHEGNKTTDLQGYQASLSKQLGVPFNGRFYFHAIQDQYQNLWLPAEQGLIRYDYKKFQFVFDSTYAFFLNEDKKRNLILSGVAGGVNIVENKSPYKVTELREKDGLHPNQQILCVFVDSKGKHWYGGGGGLTTYDYEQKKAFRYKMKSEKVPFNSVFFITEDVNNTLWFGTTKGLFRYVPLTDSFVQVAEKTIKGYVYAVENLDKNHLICVNGQDVFVLNLKDYYQDNILNIKTFNYNNGFMGLEPGQAGIYKTQDGKTWITSSDVLSIFDPKEIDFGVRAMKPIFTKIDGNSIPFLKVAQDSIYQLPKGKIDNVRIEFGSTGFDIALNPKFSYQLDNGKWSDWQEENFVILFQLAAGNHTFKVKTQVLGEQKGIVPLETSLRFRTDIHFWQSPNFQWYMMAFGLLMTGLFLLFLLKWQMEKRMLKRMQEQESELNFMRIAANQAQMSPHFIFNIIQVLQSYILQENIVKAKEMIVKLGDLVRNYLQATNIDVENKKKSIFSTEITLAKELELLQLFVEFEHTKAEHKFTPFFEIGENIESENLSIPPMIIQPIVENAIKHGLLNLPDGETGTLTIKVTYCDDVLCFIIEDTGVGVEKAEAIKALKVDKHKPMAKKLVQRKIELLNKVGYKITQPHTVDLTPHGTSVTVCFDFNE